MARTLFRAAYRPAPGSLPARVAREMADARPRWIPSEPEMEDLLRFAYADPGPCPGCGEPHGDTDCDGTPLGIEREEAPDNGDDIGRPDWNPHREED